MNIYGTKTLTQQAYVLVKQITSSHQEGEIYYWLVENEHEASVIKGIVDLLSQALSYGLVTRAIDPSRTDFTSSLSHLLIKKSGIYLLTLDTYKELSTALSLLNDNIESIEIGKRLDPSQLKKKLIKIGYSDNIEDELSFSAKGGAIQIRNGEQLYRLIFAEDELEEIADSKSKKKLTELSLIPSELDLSQLSATDLSIPTGISIYSDLLPKAGIEISDPQIIFSTFKSVQDEIEPAIHFELGEVSKYRRDFTKLGEDINNYQELGFGIIIASIDQDVIKTAFKKEKISLNNLQLVQQDGPLEGFVDQRNKIVLFSHAEIFGRKEIKKRKRRDEAAFVTKLAVNDYVVHEDHGIGRYQGLAETEIEGHKRENLVLEYAHGDKLYIPVELAYKVDKYIGEAKPKLQRLSGTSWVKMSRKASQESQQFARDLLKLYAQRSLIQTDAWSIYPDADQKLHESFGFIETPDQEVAINDVYNDLKKTEPMDRLIVGDVGFGKTEVAIRAAYQAVLNHKQVAVLCPTTLLAQQHYDTFVKRLSVLGAKVEMLSRFTGKVGDKSTMKTVKDIVAGIKAGNIDIVIGTHRLLSKDVDFHNIGLVIIDEEQRFGVSHKEKLKQLRSQAHILTLTATPIPRTLYFSLSGLRDISTIQTPPEGRQPIETEISEYNQNIIKKAIEFELKRGGQTFYLYNKVQTIQTAKRKLQELLGAKVKIDVVHGQMPPSEMARVAAEFGSGKIDVLVCTTIIENGLDLPNVNTLIVHNATRFGIGQLYQIRGRIGRGSVKAHAFLFYPEAGITGVAARRLQILEEAKELGSGFQLAMRDLEMRGMGQMLGKKQHGQIQKIGLSLYGKLLGQAVEEFETGQVQRVSSPININLPLDYGIPESLITDPEERVRLYRLISQAESYDEVIEVLKPYQEKMSAISQSDQDHLDNLIKIMELRFLAMKTEITSIDYQEPESPDGSKKKQLELAFKKMKRSYVEALIPMFPDFRVLSDKILIPADQISDWYETTKSIISLV